MEIDPIIEAVFGPPPTGIDLRESRVIANNVAAGLLLGLATVAVLLRLWARKEQKAGWGSDDWTIIASLVFNAGAAGLVVATGAFGSGRHVWATTAEELVTAAEILFYYTFVLGFCVALNKLSVLLLYNRIFNRRNDLDIFFRASLWIAMVFSSAIPFILIIVMLCACQPISYYWTAFGGAEGSCRVDTNTFFWTYGVVNAIMDFSILILPIPLILRLQMSRKRKTAVCGVMLLGSFVCVASVIRDVYLYRFAHSTDITWLMGDISLWSSIEPSIGIVSACLPNLQPLFVKVRNCVTSNHSKNTYGETNSHGSQNTWNRESKGNIISKKPGSEYTEDDEVQLTNLPTAGTSSDSIQQRSEINVYTDRTA